MLANTLLWYICMISCAVLWSDRNWQTFKHGYCSWIPGMICAPVKTHIQHVEGGKKKEEKPQVLCWAVYPQSSSSSPSRITVLLYQCDWQPQEPHERPALSEGCTFHNLVFARLCPATRLRWNHTVGKLSGPILLIPHLTTTPQRLLERVTAVMCMCAHFYNNWGGFV